MKERFGKVWKEEKLPGIDLEEGEEIEVEVKRSKKGVILIWAGETLGFVLLTIVLVYMSSAGNNTLLPLNSTAIGYLYLLIFMMYFVLVLSGWVGTMIYRSNFLVVTNKRVIQRTMTSLFTRSINVTDLASIEDVSFSEKNVIDRIFGMGTLRLSTIGDETTYTLTHVDAKTSGVRKIVKMMHVAKGGKNDKQVDKIAKA